MMKSSSPRFISFVIGGISILLLLQGNFFSIRTQLQSLVVVSTSTSTSTSSSPSSSSQEVSVGINDNNNNNNKNNANSIADPSSYRSFPSSSANQQHEQVQTQVQTLDNDDQQQSLRHDGIRTSSTTSTTNTNNNLIAIIHMGPRKTATSTIQYTLSQYDTKLYLQKDSFIYLGKGLPIRNTSFDLYARRHINDCFLLNKTCSNSSNTGSSSTSSSSSSSTQSQWNKFINVIQTARIQQQNIIISDELLARAIHNNSKHLLELIHIALHGYNDIRIIFGYRYLFDWLVSEYSQEFKQNSNNFKQSFLEWYTQHIGNHTLTTSHNITIPSKPHHISNPFHYVTKQQINFIKESIMIGSRGIGSSGSSSLNSVVQILNLHELDYNHTEVDDATMTMTTTTTALNTATNTTATISTLPIMVNLLCHIIPETKHTCTAARQGILPNEERNVSPDTIDTELIARKLFKTKNWLPSNNKQLSKILSERILQFIIEKEPTTNYESNRSIPLLLPKVCLSTTELEYLFQLSLSLEHDMIPKWYPKTTTTTPTTTTVNLHQEMMRNSFDTAIQKGKFCNIDFKQIWNDPIWKTFLERELQTVGYNDDDNNKKKNKVNNNNNNKKNNYKNMRKKNKKKKKKKTKETFQEE